MSKRNNNVIFHTDGTVSYWCALQRAWVSHEDAALADTDSAPPRHHVPEIFRDPDGRSGAEWRA